MPFKPIGNGKYKSPSGRIWTKKQIAMYHATDGFKKKRKTFKEYLETSDTTAKE
jgi:hypothetical protein